METSIAILAPPPAADPRPGPALRPGRTVLDRRGYRVDLVSGRTEIEAFAPEWRAFLEADGSATPSTLPETLLDAPDDELADLRVFVLLKEGLVAGVAPFCPARGPVPIRLGEVSVGGLPLARLRPRARGIRLPDAAAADALLAAIERSEPGIDALCLTGLTPDSPLARMVARSRWVRRRYATWRPEPTKVRLSLVLMDRYRTWLKSASSRIRRHDRMNRLRALGEVAVERITEPDEVARFVAAAARVSRRTYQYRLLGLGIRDEEKTSRRLVKFAARGHLRSYLLTVDGAPAAFYIGIEAGGVHEFLDTGFDPEYGGGSPGTVLFLRVIEDLHAWRRPRVMDLGTDADYKRGFANEVREEEVVWLFPRRDRPLAALLLLRAAAAAGRAAETALDRLGLKARLKRFLRRRSL